MNEKTAKKNRRIVRQEVDKKFKTFQDFTKNLSFWERVKFAMRIIFKIIICLMLLTSSALAQVDTTKAVIHHTASHDVSAAEIDRWHKERGWDGIGYHFVIRKDGTVEQGRSIKKLGAHAKGRNHYIGIALTGHDEFNQYQLSSLLRILKTYKVSYIESHHEKCPGEGLDIEQIKEELNND